MHRFIAAAFILVLLLATMGGAYLQVHSARESALFAQRVAYSRHLAPPAANNDLYRTLGYTVPDIRRSGGYVPRIFLAALPADIDAVAQIPQRKSVFIASLLPLILRTNELIGEERHRLISLMDRHDRGARLSPLERRWIRELAQRYGMGKVRSVKDVDFTILLQRVDRIPPSLALAQAAIESGWGTSRFAREGNALYGQWTWSANHKGLVPEQREEGRTHRIRAFDYLIDSVQGYMLNLNRNPAYRDLRLKRAALHAAGKPLSGRVLASSLTRYSERREAYVYDIKRIIAGNRLEDFDRLELAPERLKRAIAAYDLITAGQL